MDIFSIIFLVVAVWFIVSAIRLYKENRRGEALGYGLMAVGILTPGLVGVFFILVGMMLVWRVIKLKI